MNRRCRTLRAVPWALALPTCLSLVACAMQSRAPATHAEAAGSGTAGEPYKKTPAPRSIVEWEALQQRHSNLLAVLASPAPAPPDSVAPQGGPMPLERPGNRPTPRPESPPTAVSRQTIRCQKICRHVRAICHSARRICEIAARLEEEPSRRACERSRRRCRDARSVTSRNGCTGCSQARTGRRSPLQRWACRAFAVSPRRSH
ncbi:MAG: hypothetical protein ABI333_26835 [bacterium]